MLSKPIPTKMRADMDADPYYHQCARAMALCDHECEADPIRGNLIEWEHAMYYKGERVNEPWAIVPICYLVHRGGKMIKEINQWLALNRATDAELDKYPRAEWRQLRDRLNAKYGVPAGLSTHNAPF